MSGAAVSAAPTALYVYGVVPAGAELELTGAGVGSSDVRVIAEGELAAIVGAVALEEFGEEPLRQNLEDPDWLARTAHAHEAVLERALGTTTVVPFRIATLYGDEPHLREFLAANRASLLELLERLDGKVELGVKAYFDRGAQERRERGASRAATTSVGGKPSRRHSGTPTPSRSTAPERATSTWRRPRSRRARTARRLRSSRADRAHAPERRLSRRARRLAARAGAPRAGGALRRRRASRTS